MDVFDLFGRVTLKSNVEDQLSRDENNMNSFGAKMGSLLGTAAKVGAAAVGAAATAIGAISSQAVAGFARNEQLVGGIETLFGAQGMSLEQYAQSVGKSTEAVTEKYNMLMEAQTEALKNADQAYITAGMSANNYMETISGFAASLKQSTENEKEAVDVANMAVTDMADNSAKMGTSMQSIQNAYQGFAKQNYMMLDNLKLGYGGTKTEMERLLKDATALSGVEYDISNLSDVYNAIHVIQENLGITGTTAKEAMFTIEGSANATKAAWENVLVAIAKGEGLEDSLNGLTTALFGGKNGGGLLNNIIPRIKTTMEGVGNFIVKAVPLLTAKIPDMVNAIFPELLKSALTLVGMLAAELPGVLSILASTTLDVVHSVLSQVSGAILGYDMFDDLSSFMDGIMDILSERIPSFVSTGVDWLIGLFQGFGDGGVLSENISLIFESILIGLSEGLPQILEKGIELVTFFVNGILESYPSIIVTIGDILNQLISFIMENMPMFMEQGIAMIASLADGLLNNAPTIISTMVDVILSLIENILNHLPEFLQKGQEIISKLIEGIVEKTPEILTTILDLIVEIIGKIAEKLPEFLTKGGEIIGQLIKGIVDMIPDVVEGTLDIINSIFDAFANVDWLELGSQVVNGLVAGLADGASAIWDAATDAASNAFNAACDFLGINSPSKLGRYIGRMFDAGIAEDLEDNAPIDEAKNMVKSVYDSARNAVRDVEIPIITSHDHTGTIGEAGTQDSISVIYELLMQYLPLLANMQIVLQEGTLVGKLAPGMNEELGKIARWEAAR